MSLAPVPNDVAGPRRPRSRRRSQAPPPDSSSDPPTPRLSVDLARVGQLYDRLAAALPGVALHYAVKANPAAPVLQVLRGRGVRWDVASPGEIDAVLALDPRPDRLSYGNTVKKVADIAHAFDRGVRRFSLDSSGELDKLLRHAPGSTLLVRLATSGVGADWSLGGKFGCSEDEAAVLLGRAARAGHPVGVCFHVGSQQHDVHAWDPPLAATARLREVLRAEGHDLGLVDLGGGFPAANLGRHVPDLAVVGEAVLASVHRHLGPARAGGAPLPELMAEPGRCLVADAGVLETEVVLVAERGGRRWVHLDVGLFSGLAETLGEAVRYRVTAHRGGRPLHGPGGPAVLAGPTCDSVDVLYSRHRPLVPLDLRAGDRLRLHGTGAYTTTYSSVGFNGFPPLAEEHR